MFIVAAHTITKSYIMNVLFLQPQPCAEESCLAEFIQKAALPGSKLRLQENNTIFIDCYRSIINPVTV
jgi:hypothetical protein